MQLPDGGRVGVGSSTLQHNTTQQQHDRQRAGGSGGSNVGSTTARHDTQPPDGNMTGSVQVAVVVAMWVAPQHSMTCNRPTATQQAVRRQQWQGRQHHSMARHATA